MDGTKLSGVSAAGGNYRALFDHFAMPVALVSARGAPRVVAASRGFLDTLGFRRRAILGHLLDDLLAPRSRAALAAAIARCLATSESVRASVELLGRAGGRFLDLAVHSARTQGFARHVVLEAQGYDLGLGSAAPTVHFLLDELGRDERTMTYVQDLRNNRVRYVDGGLARRLGFSDGVMQVAEFRARVHPDDLQAQADIDAVFAALADEGFATQTIRVQDRLDDWRLISFRSRVLRRSRDGAVRLIIGNATDITDYAAAVVEAAGASVVRVEEKERARIGRELHDSTSQYLVAADLGLARVLQSRDLSAEERARLLSVQASLATAQAEMRAFTFLLHPPELRELGLLKSLEKFCAGFARRSGLQIAFASGNVSMKLSSDAEHALFRVCQEALMNVHRHAFARRISVALQSEGDHLTLEVRDDGVGVDGLDRFEHGGMGIAAMKSRMLDVGGDLSLDLLGPGLAVIAHVPSLNGTVDAGHPDGAPSYGPKPARDLAVNLSGTSGFPA